MKTISTATSIIFGLTTLLQAFPVVSSFAIPPSSSNEAFESNHVNILRKRAYQWGQWSHQISAFRGVGGVFPEFTCAEALGKTWYVQEVEDWPGGNRGSPLVLCQTKVKGCDGETWLYEDNCNMSDDEVINRLVASGSIWKPPLSREEATNGANQLNNPRPISLSQSVHMTGIAAPAEVQEGVIGGCTRWHVAQAGDSCYGIAEKYDRLALGKFYEWNPAVNNGGECVGLWIGYAYCVGF